MMVALKNLRFLRLEWVELVGDFQYIFPKLRWLSWVLDYHKQMNLNFSLPNLETLEISSYFITVGWDGWGMLQGLKNLKDLILYGCCYLKTTPYFPDHMTMERLLLKKCGYSLFGCWEY
ncbi:hypothetical protein SAY87_015252 [Trapa incisa]|uniref:Uncharacterized protein n=1 Tax=Trapa incisa TaxID=236973 RepID=A0AAN7GPW5_9MYRT|nr:hypothetical protein SAY87_015252 [Trapa incisa]